MAGLRLRLRIVKRFEHESGRRLLAYHDEARGSWFVEERDPPDQARRRRWYDLTEEQAAAICLGLIGTGQGWRDES